MPGADPACGNIARVKKRSCLALLGHVVGTLVWAGGIILALLLGVVFPIVEIASGNSLAGDVSLVVAALVGGSGTAFLGWLLVRLCGGRIADMLDILDLF